MATRIVSANVNILDLLVGNIQFLPGLNIVSGENGTLKTRLLQQMRNEPNRLELSDADLRQIAGALEQVTIQGDRYPAALQARVGR